MPGLPEDKTWTMNRAALVLWRRTQKVNWFRTLIKNETVNDPDATTEALGKTHYSERSRTHISFLIIFFARILIHTLHIGTIYRIFITIYAVGEC
jgi:hypothetical protein